MWMENVVAFSMTPRGLLVPLVTTTYVRIIFLRLMTEGHANVLERSQTRQRQRFVASWRQWLKWRWVSLSHPKLFLWITTIIDKSHVSLRKQPTFREVATWAFAKRRLSNERRNSILMTCTTQILVVLLIGWKKIPSQHNQSEALPRSG